MTARWWTVLLIILLLGSSVVVATPPQKVVYSPPQQQQAYVPSYGPSFNASEDYLKQIVAKLDSIDKRLERIEGKIGAVQGTTQDGALGIIGSRCLACHQDGKAADKGGDFILVEKDGTLAELSLAEKRRINKMVTTGKMPPSGKLADAEAKQLVDFFSPKEELKK